MAKKRKNRKLATLEGLPIVDATQCVALVIKPRDVEGSKRKDPSACAAALAGRREFNTEVRVYMTRMYVKDKKRRRWVRFITPQSVQKEIVSFDRGAQFEPGEYEFKPPPPSARIDYRRGRPGGTPTKTGKKTVRHVVTNVRESALDVMRRK